MANVKQTEAEDFVVATGETHEVREFVQLAFQEVGIEIQWQGEGINEKGINKADGKVLVEVDSRYFRPTEVELLLGDPTKAKAKLGWEPKTTLQELCSMMVSEDLKSAKKDLLCEKNGFKIENYNE